MKQNVTEWLLFQTRKQWPFFRIKQICLIAALAALLLFHSAIKAQDAYEPSKFPEIIPPSPQAFSMTKYGDLPIGLFTGTAQFNVPIYNITCGKINHAISVDYSTNGVKVDEIPGRVGAGWTLKAGGVIAKTTYGLPDDGIGVFRKKPASHSDTSWEMYHFLVDNVEPADPQPDEYSFSFDGYSGKFIIVDGQIKQLKHAGIKIEKPGTDIFRITTPNGFQYYFGENLAHEESESNKYNESDRPTIFNRSKSAWMLTKVISTANDTLVFNYTASSNFSFTGASEYFTPILGGANTIYYYNFYAGNIEIANTVQCLPDYEFHNSFHTSQGGSMLLNEIIFKNGKVKFYYSVREDQGDRKVDSIRISNKNDDLINVFRFSYVYASNPTTEYDTKYVNTTIQALYPALRKRLFLTSIEEGGNKGAAGQKYNFEYNDMNQLPPRLSYSQDLFGYYNKKKNHHFIPNNTYVDDLHFEEIGGDRSFDFDGAVKGTLKKVTYPTGGSSVIEYEPHLIHGYNKRTVTRDTMYMSLINSSVRGQEVTSPMWPRPRVFYIKAEVMWAGTPPPPEAIRGDEGITLSVFDSITNNCIICNFPIKADTIIELKKLNTTYENSKFYATITATFAGITAYVSIIRKDAFVVSNVDQPLAGVRVKSIIDQDGITNVIKKKKYLYSKWNTPSHSSGQLFFPGVPETNNVSVGRKFTQIPGFGDFACAYYTVGSSGTANLYLNDYSTVSYTDVVEVFENEAIVGGIEHQYLSVPKSQARPLAVVWMSSVWNHSPLLIPGTPSTNDDFNNGAEVYTGTFTMQNGARKFAVKKYNFFSKDTRLFSQDTAYAARKVMTRPSYDLSWKYFADHDLNRYFINHYWTHIDSTIAVQYEGNDSLISKTFYQYNNLVSLLPTRIETKNSKGEWISNVFTYTNELAAPGNTYRFMEERNMIGEVVYSRKEKNTVPLLSTLKKFKLVPAGNFIVEDTIINKYEQSGAADKLIFKDYDLAGNPIKFYKQNDIITQVIWDYNLSLPVAKVTSANEGIIAYTSFEADGWGGWTMNPGSVIINNYPGITGKNTISGGVQKVIPAGNYIVSFWSIASSWLNGQLVTQTPARIIGPWRYYEIKLTNVSSINVAGDNIDEIRLYPQGAQMTTYTYDPLIGMTSQCDANNRIAYYEYDSFGRLLCIRDDQRNILKQYEYKFQSDTSSNACATIPNWQNVRTECGIGGALMQIQVDANPCSLTSNTERSILITANYQPCLVCTGPDKKWVNNVCETATKVTTASVRPPTGGWQCTYHYEWSDGSRSPDYTENSSFPCMIIQ